MTLPSHPSDVRTAGHTPGPWHVDHKLSVKYGDEERWSFKIWATDEVSKIQFYICTSGENYWPSQNPNAAFIVRACNSFDELVEALKAVQHVKQYLPTHIEKLVSAALLRVQS